MEIHNKLSLALIPFSVVLITILQYSCMGQGYTPPYTGYGYTPPYTGPGSRPPYTGPGSRPPYTGPGYLPPYMGQLPPPPHTGHGSSPPYMGKDSPPPYGSRPPYTGHGSPPPHGSRPPYTGYGSRPPNDSPPPNTDHDDSPQAYIDAHNAARAEVNVPKMAWSNTVAEVAKSYANIRKSDCALKHSGTKKYGENIAEGTDTQFNATDAVNMWVAEKSSYHHDSNQCDAGEMCGHYTQVVWKNSVRLGCARDVCDNGRGVFIICNYDPPGNYVDQSPY